MCCKYIFVSSSPVLPKLVLCGLFSDFLKGWWELVWNLIPKLRCYQINQTAAFKNKLFI